jgi:hypothetical protein
VQRNGASGPLLRQTGTEGVGLRVLAQESSGLSDVTDRVTPHWIRASKDEIIPGLKCLGSIPLRMPFLRAETAFPCFLGRLVGFPLPWLQAPDLSETGSPSNRRLRTVSIETVPKRYTLGTVHLAVLGEHQISGDHFLRPLKELRRPVLRQLTTLHGGTHRVFLAHSSSPQPVILYRASF